MTDTHTPARHIYDAIIIGGGAAGLNAADSLFDMGITNIALVTEGLAASTSIGTGSDKQTYYKLTTSGSEPDSVADMAKTYFSCGGMQGYHALKEAAYSLRCFYKLVEAGVPFPTNEYGEYVGYRTDHDTRARASSCGPLTSKYMCEALIQKIRQKNIAVFEPMRAVKLLVGKNGVRGVVALAADTAEFHVFAAHNVILAAGGPAGLYASSVYPKAHTGGVGIALEIGARAASLCEWQYGLASTDFRWNLSGSYQQVIPRYISVDADGNVHEFLNDYRTYLGENTANAVFRKGYHWPFAAKSLTAEDNSSFVDLAVYAETAIKGRKVFLDYRSNPSDYSPDAFDAETRAYLDKSGITHLPTPIARLRKLNEKAYQLYLAHGIDLEKEPLAADVCAQHCNGGLAVDENYMTNVPGLYAAGECAGVFGVTRPGGSALNSTQVSSLCAATNIVSVERKADFSDFDDEISKVLAAYHSEIDALRQNKNGQSPLVLRAEFAKRMSEQGAFIREKRGICALKVYADTLRQTLMQRTVASTAYDIYQAFINRDLVTTMQAVICSFEGFAAEIGTSRGGFLICHEGEGTENTPEMRTDALFYAAKNVKLCEDMRSIITVGLENGAFCYRKEEVSPIPQSGQWFEDYLGK